MRVLLCLAAVAAFLMEPGPARAAVYRCVDAGGHVSFQQFPCQAGDEPIKLKTPRPGSGWSVLREGEKALLDSYRDKAPRPRSTQRKKKAPVDAVSCWNRRMQLQEVIARLRHGYTLEESAALRLRRDRHADFLRRFCAGAG